MTDKIKVFVRTDLNMRKGKMGAQVSHAVGSVLISLMQYDKYKNIFLNSNNTKKINDWILNKEKIELFPVENENFLDLEINKNLKNSSIIVDSGRTEFKGVPTKTCGAIANWEVNHSLINLDYLNNTQKEFSDKGSKQVIIINKELKMDKWDVSKESAISSFKSLINSFTFDEKDNTFYLKNEKTNVINWLIGNFAKIVVKASSDELNNISLNLIEQEKITFNIEKNNDGIITSITIGPDKIENVDKFSSGLQLY